MFLPIALVKYLNYPSFKPLVIFYLGNIFIVFYFLRKNHNRIRRLRFRISELQEKINVLGEQNLIEHRNKIGLHDKVARYNSLKKIIEDINQNLDLEPIADRLSEIAFSFIGRNKGVCTLYLVDKINPIKLNLFKTKKEDSELIIKTKEGDRLDIWVLRHSTPLLIEDVKKDFRFDFEKLKAGGELVRPVSSLVSAPLISENKFLGILRIDNQQAHFYSQDDLRFLMTICEIGAVALENGQLFKEAQDLAIHDELTSLYTKGYFLERLKEEYKRSLRHNRTFSLLILDIDYFKSYNDRFGHTAGDIVLRALSQSITSELKSLNPLTSRFGGEEFALVLLDMDKEGAVNVAQRLRQAIEKMEIVLRWRLTSVTVSIGVANFPADAKDEDELIFKADMAMYAAKQKGRNRVIGA